MSLANSFVGQILQVTPFNIQIYPANLRGATPLPHAAVNSFVISPAKNYAKKAQVTWAHSYDSKEAHKKLDVTNHCDHNLSVIAKTTHPTHRVSCSVHLE